MEDINFYRVEDYRRELLSPVIEKIFSRRKLDSRLSEGDLVLLKINLLRGAEPGEAVTTHPELVSTVAEAVSRCGAEVKVADSPGGPFKSPILHRHYKKSGFVDKEEVESFELNYDTSSSRLKVPEGKRTKSLNICEFAREADFIINLPKLKTHGLTEYTGAVKNMFGIIPGMEKAEYHLKFPDAVNMSHLFLDIYQVLEPGLNIVDGILGMEGEGPGSGTPRRFEVIMAARDGIRLDLAISHLLQGDGFLNSPLFTACREREMEFSPTELDYPEWLQDKFAGIKIPENNNSRLVLSESWPDIAHKIVDSLLRPRPVFSEERCIGCGVCRENCPVEVIELEDGIARVDLSGCIRCFCCQELCPHEAVKIDRPLPGRILFG